jgi:hypothetical protein
MGRGFVEREGIDAPVTCDHCWHLKPENIHYSRRAKQYYCSLSSNHRDWMIEMWERDGKRPEYGRYGA